MNYSRPLTVDYDYPVAFSGWGDEEYAAIDRVVRSGRFTFGPEVEALEHEFSAYHGMKHGIAVNSGSSANLIAVAAISQVTQPGESVLIPALAWATTFAPFIQHGFEPVLLDCDQSWNAVREGDALLASHNVGPISAIATCSILGNPIDGAFWQQLSENAKVPWIDDCCESVGARDLDRRLVGTRALASTFSFFYSHQLSAVEGGMILTNSELFANQCRMLRNHGWSRGVSAPKDFGQEYEFIWPGYNVRPTEIYAAIAREQLKKLDARIIARQTNLEYFVEQLRGLPIRMPIWRGLPSPFGIHFEVTNSAVRANLAAALRAEGIDCRPPVGGSFRKQPYGSRWAHQRTPNADRIHERGIMLGNPPFDGTELIDRAVKVMRKVL